MHIVEPPRIRLVASDGLDGIRIVFVRAKSRQIGIIVGTATALIQNRRPVAPLRSVVAGPTSTWNSFFLFLFGFGVHRRDVAAAAFQFREVHLAQADSFLY